MRFIERFHFTNIFFFNSTEIFNTIDGLFIFYANLFTIGCARDYKLKTMNSYVFIGFIFSSVRVF